MDENCTFLAKLLYKKKEINFCELVLIERQIDKNKHYLNILELYKNSPCEKISHENCRYYYNKINRLDEVAIR
jgi:hypothetical protein